MAGLLSFSKKEGDIQQSDLNSFLWVAAVRRANYHLLVLALVLFAIVFTTKDQGKGTGLGLGIVRGIVEKHGGRIEAYSRTGEGAEFRVLLPVE